MLSGLTFEGFIHGLLPLIKHGFSSSCFFTVCMPQFNNSSETHIKFQLTVAQKGGGGIWNEHQYTSCLMSCNKLILIPWKGKAKWLCPICFRNKVTGGQNAPGGVPWCRHVSVSAFWMIFTKSFIKKKT